LLLLPYFRLSATNPPATIESRRLGDSVAIVPGPSVRGDSHR
jgi:hypothetical protein